MQPKPRARKGPPPGTGGRPSEWIGPTVPQSLRAPVEVWQAMKLPGFKSELQQMAREWLAKARQ